jgi:hypothetical protein
MVGTSAPFRLAQAEGGFSYPESQVNTPVHLDGASMEKLLKLLKDWCVKHNGRSEILLDANKVRVTLKRHSGPSWEHIDLCVERAVTWLSVEHSQIDELELLFNLAAKEMEDNI